MIKYGTNNIGKIYFGSNLIGKAYFGSNLVYSSGSGPGPGPQPTGIAYIRGGADGSYIDTGITANNTVKVIVWARNWLPYSEALFGSRASANSNELAVCATSGAEVDEMRIRFGTSNAAFAENAITEVYSHYHKYEYSEGVFKVDDVVKATVTTQTFNNNFNIHLFGINTGGTHTLMNLPADIHACKIYKAGVLVRDFTAVNTPSVGLYDAVSDTVFTNSGNGSFTYGEFDENAYTPLEYIECDGNQYFDSGIRGSNSLNYTVKFRNGGTSAWPDLFFAQTSNSSKRYGLAFGNSTTPNSVVFFTFNTTNKDYAYGSSFAGKDLVASKSGVDHYLYENNTQKTKQTHTAATFTTDYNIFVGAGNNAGSVVYNYTGRIYYLGFSSSRNFVPAKVNNVSGMYDTYNDMFYPSASSTPFIAGPTL